MNIVITGANSGVGQALCNLLQPLHEITALTRDVVDLASMADVIAWPGLDCDILVNAAATGRGGKQPFCDHPSDWVAEILTTNLLAPVLLTQKVLRINPACRVVNITSTNNRRYHNNDLAYSLSKQSLAMFDNMLRVEYPQANLLEVRLGLTRTGFNANRYRDQPERLIDVYQQPHLDVNLVASKICTVLFDSTVHMIEIAP